MLNENKAVILDSEQFCLILKGKSTQIQTKKQNELFLMVNGMVAFANLNSENKIEDKKICKI